MRGSSFLFALLVIACGPSSRSHTTPAPPAPPIDRAATDVCEIQSDCYPLSSERGLLTPMVCVDGRCVMPEEATPAAACDSPPFCGQAPVADDDPPPKSNVRGTANPDEDGSAAPAATKPCEPDPCDGKSEPAAAAPGAARRP